MGTWQYDDQDIERLSMIMTLHDIGFTKYEVENYMRLLLQGKSTEAQRLNILNKRHRIMISCAKQHYTNQ